MSAYYNEHDPYAAAWLRNLISAELIAFGDVDERSIEDVKPSEIMGYTQCHFFAGIGIWSLALRSAGWSDSREIWTGSCPCQPFSAAGKGAGFADERHLWPAFFHLIEQCRPPVVMGEQVASQDGLAWLDLVRSDLEGAGYAAGASDTCAAGYGAPHIRQRTYWVADAEFSDIWGKPRTRNATTSTVQGTPQQRQWSGNDDSPCGSVGRPSPTNGYWRDADWLGCRDGKWRPVEPGTFPLAHGAASRVGRLRAYGNAIVAPQATEIIRAFMECRP